MKAKEKKERDCYGATQEVYYGVLAGMVLVVLLTTFIELGSAI